MVHNPHDNLAAPQLLSGKKRIALGAIGGVVVAAATYPFGDRGYVDLLIQLDWLEISSFTLRLLICSLAGGFWGYLHDAEHSPIRAFQIGIVAPATIAGMVYANDIGTGSAMGKQEALSSATVSVLATLPRSPIGTAQAGGSLLIQQTPPPPEPPSDTVTRVLKGLLGK